MEDLNTLTATKILEATTIVYTHRKKVNIENRKNYCLSIAKEGELVYHHGDKKYVSDADHAIFIPKGASYCVECREIGSFTLLNFECDEDSGFSDFKCIKITPDKAYFHDQHEIENLFLFKNNELHPRSLSIFYSMVSRIVQNSEQLGVFPVLRPAVEYMQSHIGEPMLTNEMLSNMAGISEVYFRRLFRQCYGVSPGQYMLRIKIDKAKQLLRTESVSVTEISALCGYSNVYHFCEIFKKKTGITPTEYRKNNMRTYL